MILKKLGDEYKLYSHDSCIATTHESPYKKLSIKNCEAIANGYDLYELTQTEWDVEICCYIGNGDKELDSFKDPLVTNTGIPKLDSDGCLILKRK